MKVKDERLSLRVNAEDKKLIQKRCIDKGMKISEYVMDLVKRDIAEMEEKNLNKE